jgi:hypothetical protein
MMKKVSPIAVATLAVLTIVSACAPAPQPTPDEDAINTAVAQTVVALPTQAPPPTSTPTPEPQPTPVPGDPAVSLGPPDGRDTFDNPNSWNWSYFDNTCFKNEISGGKFLMEAKGLVGTACWTLSWPEVEDYYVETSAVMPSACAPDDRFGFIFRAPDNDRGYLFGLACDGSYSLTAWTGETTLVIVPVARNDVIQTAAGSVNRMGLLVQGDTLTLYMNGVEVASATDDTFPDAGKIGYFIRAATDQPFVSAYNEIALWVLE